MRSGALEIPASTRSLREVIVFAHLRPPSNDLGDDALLLPREDGPPTAEIASLRLALQKRARVVCAVNMSFHRYEIRDFTTPDLNVQPLKLRIVYAVGMLPWLWAEFEFLSWMRLPFEAVLGALAVVAVAIGLASGLFQRRRLRRHRSSIAVLLRHLNVLRRALVAPSNISPRRLLRAGDDDTPQRLLTPSLVSKRLSGFIASIGVLNVGFAGAPD